LKFIGEFVDELDRKRDQLSRLFGLDEKVREDVELLGAELERRWRHLPEPKTVYEPEFSVDSSSAYRSLSNGLDFLIVRALMIGTGGYRKPLLRFEAVKGISEYTVASDFERVMRELLEVEIVLDNIGDVPDGSVVLIDGNLYGRYTHALREIGLAGWHHLPLKLLYAMWTLYEECAERGIMVVGVSKFSKTRALTRALLPGSGADTRFLDVELLYRRKTGETGYTEPLLLGEYGVDPRVKDMYGSPGRIRKRLFRGVPERLHGFAEDVLEKVPSFPAIVMFHVIPRENAQPMRVDIPASLIGLDKKISDVTPFEFVDWRYADGVSRQVTAAFGGRDVYNALLYIVDKEVRLSAKAVDTVYKSVLGREMGVPIEYDRSTRRFTY
jgi:hypothetical protein